MAWIVFWLAVAVTAITSIFLGHRARQNMEATIRHGIDKGVISDAAGIATARLRPTVPWPMWLIVFGVLHVFAGVGIGIFAYFIGVFEPDSLMPLVGIAAFTFVLGLGFLVAGFWLRRALKRD